jgi:hypothetical protein
VPGVWLIDPSGRYAHTAEPKLHGERIGDCISILRANEINRGFRRRVCCQSDYGKAKRQREK